MCLKILLVDDDDGVRDYSARILEEACYIVYTAGRADEAEALLRTAEGVDLLIADIVLPGRDGVALARALRRAHPAAKVLFTTGYTRHIAPDLLADAALLDKPYHREALLHAVRHLLGRASAGETT
jgi:two-component system, cell cycle sensor histidine kinase and response regulator CckA